MRDTAFGEVVRLITRNRVFKYPEEEDPEHWKNYLNEEKSGWLAYHGQTQPPENASEETLQHAQRMRTGSGQANNGGLPRDSTQTDATYIDGTYNEVSGMKVDPEKGKDKHLIDWYDENDREVCCHE